MSSNRIDYNSYSTVIQILPVIIFSDGLMTCLGMRCIYYRECDAAFVSATTMILKNITPSLSMGALRRTLNICRNISADGGRGYVITGAYPREEGGAIALPLEG